MITKRIIPCLDVKNGRVVKGVNFEGLSDVSSPVELGKYYSDNGADELVFYDITASSEGRTYKDGTVRYHHRWCMEAPCLILPSGMASLLCPHSQTS